MMYNAENLFDTFDDPLTNDNDFLPDSDKQWTNKRYQHKLDQLSKVILGVDVEPPAIIGLVEIENALVLQELTGHAYLKAFNYDFIHHNSPDQRGIDVALLYNKDKFTVLEHYAIHVPLEKNDNTRDILYVKGTFSGNEEPVHFFVNHWPSRREGQKETEPKRIIAAEQLKQHVDRLFETETTPNIVIMGDFNDYPDSKSLIEILAAKFSKSVKSNELFNLSYAKHMDGRGSYNYKGNWVMMDQFIISGNLLDKKNEASYFVKHDGLEVFDEKWLLYKDRKFNEMKPHKTYGGNNYYGGYSDHLPVYIKLICSE